MSTNLRFDGKVAVVTGAGRGIGRSLAIALAKRGCKVIVNDLGLAMDGHQAMPTRLADDVVAEIKAFGGEAFGNYDSVEFGEKLINDAIAVYGRIDIVVNNAGILRDKAFHKMKESDWDLVQLVHMKGTYKVARAAWPHFRNQKSGKVLNISSASGIYGNFGQANYSTAKLAIHGFTNTLAREGETKNIQVNTLAPVAATRMTKGVMSKELFDSVSVDHIIPSMVYLVHESCDSTGALFEVGGGWFAKLRIERTKGVSFDLPCSAEDVRDRFDEIGNFDGEVEHPESGNGSVLKMYENYERNQNLKGNKTKKKGLKSPQIFELIHNYLNTEGADAVQACNATYNFRITQKKKGKVVKTWGIDLKNGNGCVTLKPFASPDAVFTMTDSNFYKVCMRELNPQIAFLQGKMKIKGNMKKAQLFNPDLFPKPTPENFETYRGAKL